ncbi:hypothetical protein VOLCADRAFT_102804 [Volvox carteri f. nagariensis]|uniref:Pherophorin domain-containing protein n=1 Tax=Volvox carteri f. nagariensis TaxID=3068 RepID=D8TI87_VOLCA|nr:uncharacterized protein VOLCADRAFT_102804 [Volvox carteri f. nagariensis]EFJ53196.1 hypothetical protein VOLCADRAFT_102804 [Volvox carteri f. nagariensis]|eukprot:XP_002946201.1 hypothetical protein VOLCADRAFT_102804 [Volvox carteri f. nagariensis]
MARRALRPRLARLLLCLAMSWMTTAVADTSLEEQLDSQATVDPRFPYCSCYRLPANPSPYNFAPTVTVKGKGQYCFKILVNSTGCTGRCCNVDLNKIEFDVNAKCLAKSASVKATINGKFTLVGPNYYTYQLDNGTYRYVLRLTSLTMGLSDNNAELCLNLTAGVNDAGCGTLEELCVPPSVSSPPGTCQVALLNSLNSTDTCCPIRYSVYHLGITVNTAEGLFEVPAGKLAKLRRLAVGLRVTAKKNRRLVQKRELAQLCGFAQSVKLALTPAPLFLRNFYDDLAQPKLSRDPARLWPERQTTQGAERWFDRVLAQCGLEGLRSVHTLYSLRRGGASAARAAGVPLDIIEAFGGWAAGSSALRENYLDLGVRGCPRAVAFFGPLAARRVAPVMGQYFNR